MEERIITMESLTVLLRAAESAHEEYEEKAGRRDDDWAKWYTQYIFEQLPRVHHATNPEMIPSSEPYLNE